MITFKDYLAEEDPIKHGTASIKVTEIDFKKATFDNSRDQVVTLEVHKKFYEYFIPKNSKHLYTMDSDGNKQKLSVFFYEPETSNIHTIIVS